MGSGRRITVALVGLVLLALIGWLATDLSGHHTSGRHSRPAVVSVSPSAPRPADASG
ncbi:MAG TPA: hypothetical protein VFW65_23900 [Pseudonocardiaceae bacterium]|nr:hypothetical protein [Pseudonocardiaceae bacterium]